MYANKYIWGLSADSIEKHRTAALVNIEKEISYKCISFICTDNEITNLIKKSDKNINIYFITNHLNNFINNKVEPFRIYGKEKKPVN